MTTNDPTPRPPCPDTAKSVTCEKCTGFLLDYVDGVLPDAERFAFESHVAFCKDCEVYLDSYRKASALTNELGRDERSKSTECVPEELIEAILRARKHRH